MKGLLFLIGSFLLVSCAALPAIQLGGDQMMVCPSPFLLEKTRFIHVIEAGTGGETKAVMIGVTVADPFLRTLSCAIVSPEGLSLFEACFGPSGVTVGRALPPFNAADFASNMMEDMKLIFFAPPGNPSQKGVLNAREAVCRWHKESGGWIDVAKSPDGRIRILLYSDGGRLKRSVSLSQPPGNPYSFVELEARELIEYKLVMTLIEAETVKD
jgi:hypothetical protein